MKLLSLKTGSVFKSQVLLLNIKQCVTPLIGLNMISLFGPNKDPDSSNGLNRVSIHLPSSQVSQRVVAYNMPKALVPGILLKRFSQS